MPLPEAPTRGMSECGDEYRVRRIAQRAGRHRDDGVPPPRSDLRSGSTVGPWVMLGRWQPSIDLDTCQIARERTPLDGQAAESTVLEGFLDDQWDRGTPPSRWERVRPNPTTVSIASAFTDCSRPSLGKLTATAAIGST